LLRDLLDISETLPERDVALRSLTDHIAMCVHHREVRTAHLLVGLLREHAGLAAQSLLAALEGASILAALREAGAPQRSECRLRLSRCSGSESVKDGVDGEAEPYVGVSVDEGTGVGGQVGELVWGQ